MSAVKLLFIRAFISPPTEKSDGFPSEQRMREREKKGEVRDLIPPSIRLQPANLHLSAETRSLGRVLLHCCGVWISAHGWRIFRALLGRKWLKRC